jgi:diphosphate-dependent phosphofructokinase
MGQSLLQKLRLEYQPKLPPTLESFLECTVSSLSGEHVLSKQIQELFPKTGQIQPLEIKLKRNDEEKVHAPLRVGVLLSGGQAPGGHNVITGLFDALKKLNPSSQLFGFQEGPSGIIKNKFIELTKELLADYRNQGGFDLIGSGRTKIETPAQFQFTQDTVRALALDGLVIIGGDDSNTNAALLAEYFSQNEIKTAVIGIPKTIDGDLKNSEIESSFGFDTACKTYSECIGNLMRDALSAKKYYYFVKLMGRSASHIALECALQTHPNMAIIGEEVEKLRKTLSQLISEISDLIVARADKGKNYGVILIPEGLLEFIPEVRILIKELNLLLSEDRIYGLALEKLASDEQKIEYISKFLSSESQNCFRTLPKEIQAQLLIGRDAHGNVQVSKIETERMFIDLVKKELKRRAKLGAYSGSFSPQPHFCGYEGRCCLPSNFDAQYCYALGHVAAILINFKQTGFMCRIRNLHLPVENWQAGGVPLNSMIVFEERHGEMKPVIQKALVDLEGHPFENFSTERTSWSIEDDYIYPGPIQFFGPSEITESITRTLELESD